MILFGLVYMTIYNKSTDVPWNDPYDAHTSALLAPINYEKERATNFFNIYAIHLLQILKKVSPALLFQQTCGLKLIFRFC